MPTLTVQTIPSFKEYIIFIEDLHPRFPGALWFRGCGKSDFTLTPSLFRHKFSANIEQLMETEKSLLYRFQQRSIPFLTRDMHDEWEWLFLMQHYGVPTRLLDWTENPMTALFFAVMYAQHNLDKSNTVTFNTDAAVWILSPNIWNKKAIDLSSFNGSILTTNDSSLAAYTPPSDPSVMKDFPLAIYGSHNSQRIVAQRGVFVVFGKITRPMELMYTDNDFPQDCIIKIVLPKAKLPSFLEALHRNGITDSMVFPDLDGLAREIKREFKFEV